MKAYGELDIQFHVFLTSRAVWKWVVILTSRPFYLRKEKLRYSVAWILVGPATGEEVFEEIIQFVHIFENETTIPPSSSP
jgi:hypothetical protein